MARSRRDRDCLADQTQSELREHVWMVWNIGRPEHGAFQLWPVLDHRADGPAIRDTVPFQQSDSRIERSLHHHRASVVERMADHGGRLDPFQTMCRERKGTPER